MPTRTRHLHHWSIQDLTNRIQDLGPTVDLSKARLREIRKYLQAEVNGKDRDRAEAAWKALQAVGFVWATRTPKKKT